MKNLKMILFGIMMLFCMSIVYATNSVSLTLPANNANINGTYAFTATITSSDNTWNNSNCTFATTTDGIFGINKENGTTIINTSNTASLTETASTTVTVTCYNYSSTSSISDTSTGVAIDNTDPVCSCSLDRQYIDVGKMIDYDCSGSTDTTALSYSCTATYDSGDTETQTDKNGYLENTYSLGDVSSVVCTVTDEVSKTDTCSALSTRISGDGDVDSASQQQQKKNTLVIVFILIIVVVIVVVSIITMSMKGKKKGKRG